MAKKRKILETLSEDEMYLFEDMLKFWCSHHPSNCYKGCRNLSQCKNENKLCDELVANISLNTYEALFQQMPTLEKPAAKTIAGWYGDWDKYKKLTDEKRELGKKTPLFEVLIKYLIKFSEDPYLDDDRLELYLKDLNTFYDNHQLKKGYDLSRIVIKRYPYHKVVIQKLALFHNRRMEWNALREELTQKNAKARFKKDIINECYLGIFESHLNEFAHYCDHSASYFEALKRGKSESLDRIILDEIKGEQHRSKYHYLFARYLEEEWWVLPPEAKQSNLHIIINAIKSINLSIKHYKPVLNNKGEYNKPWWLYGHKAILMKLLDRPTYVENIEEFGSTILEKSQKITNSLKKSIQTYAITYYILLDKSAELEKFLANMDIQIKYRLSEVNISEENYMNEVDNSTFHHVKIIFHNNESKQKEYYSILNDWLYRNIN